MIRLLHQLLEPLIDLDKLLLIPIDILVYTVKHLILIGDLLIEVLSLVFDVLHDT